ncbi:MAG: outer membrane beta-barrel protein [Acidobacteriota bacterium]|nr:outer membrane beta-barrel protein [Acidobacteriota bacterium]
MLSLAAFTFAATPATAQNRGSVGGQAGVTFQSETATVFAGEFTVRLAPVAEIYGSVGRMQDAMPSEIQDILNFVDSSLNASVPALYGISGVRLGLSEGSVRPYGIAGAGLAHLAGKFEYAGRDITSLVEDEIGYSLTSTEFAFELGGGVIIPAGAKAFIDTGYRYMRITGSDMNVSRVYGGFGVRF